MDYLSFLRRLHEALSPRRYLEIGVRWGHSLNLARCPSVGIDPAFEITQELHTEVHLFRTTSDEYFTRDEPLGPVGGQPFDLTYIDGMHLFEFALRDFINAERNSRSTGMIVFDDMLPRTADEAARVCITSAWTGDIYPIISVVRRYRPDLITVLVDTAPTGLMLLMGLDPDNTVLADHYDEIVQEYRTPDPQSVPAELLHRIVAQPPARMLGSGLLEILSGAGDEPDRAALSDALRARATENLGPAYALGEVAA